MQKIRRIGDCMCEFCGMRRINIICSNKPIISHIEQGSDGIGTIVCGIDDKKLKASSMIQTSSGISRPIAGEAKINYCPICGRTLSDV